MTIFLSEHDAARLGLNGAKPKKQSAKDARPDLPRAPAGAGDRLGALMRLACHGYGPRFDPGIGFAFWNPRTGARTTAHQGYAAACIAAEREVQL